MSEVVLRKQSYPEEASVLTGSIENEKRYNLMSGNNKYHKEIKVECGGRSVVKSAGLDGVSRDIFSSSSWVY